jgi:4-hydroxysphinganine ceramide fatty acyl 2-hydroxylase
MRFAGKDVGDKMGDRDEHDHSDSAYDMLEEYIVGRIGVEATIVNEGARQRSDEYPHLTRSRTQIGHPPKIFIQRIRTR